MASHSRQPHEPRAGRCPQQREIRLRVSGYVPAMQTAGAWWVAGGRLTPPGGALESHVPSLLEPSTRQGLRSPQQAGPLSLSTSTAVSLPAPRPSVQCPEHGRPHPHPTQNPKYAPESTTKPNSSCQSAAITNTPAWEPSRGDISLLKLQRLEVGDPALADWVLAMTLFRACRLLASGCPQVAESAAVSLPLLTRALIPHGDPTRALLLP